MSRGRTVLVVALLAAGAVVAAWYASPYMTLHAMRDAAREGDADTFNEHVDYPKLRASLKAQFEGRVNRALGGGGDDAGGGDTGGGGAGAGGNAVQRAGASLGRLLGKVVADRAVDALVRPATVMAALNAARVGRLGGRVGDGEAGGGTGVAADGDDAGTGAEAGPGAGADPGAGATADSGASPHRDRAGSLRWRIERRGLSRVVAYGDRPGQPGTGRYGFVFEREGLLDWKLVAIRFPRQPGRDPTPDSSSQD